MQKKKKGATPTAALLLKRRERATYELHRKITIRGEKRRQSDPEEREEKASRQLGERK